MSDFLMKRTAWRCCSVVSFSLIPPFWPAERCEATVFSRGGRRRIQLVVSGLNESKDVTGTLKTVEAVEQMYVSKNRINS